MVLKVSQSEELSLAICTETRGFNYMFENCGLIGGEFGQIFAINLNVGFEQTVDEAGIANVQRGKGGVDAHNPQRAEIAAAEFCGRQKRIDRRGGQLRELLCTADFWSCETLWLCKDFVVTPQARCCSAHIFLG